MLYAIIALFALAAVVGLIILKNWLTAKNTSRAVVYTHGVLAAAGLGALLYYAVNNGMENFQTIIILFVIAAIGGFYMFFRDLKGKMSPVWMAVVHALIAVAAFAMLVLLVV